MERNKTTILKSGIDPDLKRLRYLQGRKSNQEKRYVKALENIESYWDDVRNAIESTEAVVA